MTTVDEAIDVLNAAKEADLDAIQALVGHRVPCNERLANHPTVQVGRRLEPFSVGMLGIINGLFGVDEKEWGFIGAEYKGDGTLLRFVRVSG